MVRQAADFRPEDLATRKVLLPLIHSVVQKEAAKAARLLRAEWTASTSLV